MVVSELEGLRVCTAGEETVAAIGVGAAAVSSPEKRRTGLILLRNPRFEGLAGATAGACTKFVTGETFAALGWTCGEGTSCAALISGSSPNWTCSIGVVAKAGVVCAIEGEGAGAVAGLDVGLDVINCALV